MLLASLRAWPWQTAVRQLLPPTLRKVTRAAAAAACSEGSTTVALNWGDFTLPEVSLSRKEKMLDALASCRVSFRGRACPELAAEERFTSSWIRGGISGSAKVFSRHRYSVAGTTRFSGSAKSLHEAASATVIFIFFNELVLYLLRPIFNTAEHL